MENHPTAVQLFVYGTLMSRYANPHAVALRTSATLVGPATYRGKMFLVRGPRGTMTYPALIPSDDPLDRVHGELYRLHDAAVLQGLDGYEGAEYRRQVAEVQLAEGGLSPAYVYLYIAPTADLPRIPNGRFIAGFDTP